MKAYATSPDFPLLTPAEVSPRPNDFVGLTSADRAPREDIQHRAYAIWQREGEPSDRELSHWLQAELEVMGGKSTRG